MHYSPASCIWQLFLGVWVLLVEYGTLDFSGDDFVRGAMLGLTLDTGLATVLGFWKIFTYFLRRRGLGFWRFFFCRMEKYAQSMLRFEPSRVGSCVMMWGIFRAQCAFSDSPVTVESPVLLPINPQGLWTHAFRLKDRVKNNHNNHNNHNNTQQNNSNRQQQHTTVTHNNDDDDDNNNNHNNNHHNHHNHRNHRNHTQPTPLPPQPPTTPHNPPQPPQPPQPPHSVAILAQEQFRSEILRTAVRLWKGSTLFLPCLRWPRVFMAMVVVRCCFFLCLAAGPSLCSTPNSRWSR